MLQYEIACDRICDDIAEVLFSLKPATKAVALIAARATQDVASAFHHAAGDPVDPRWSDAVGSLERFINVSKRSRTLEDSEALRELTAFVDENADALRSAEAVAA